MNPIKTSDIYQDSGDLKKLVAELQAVRAELEALQKEEVKRAATLEKATRNLNETMTDQRDQIAENAKAADEIQKRFSKYTEALDENAVKIAAIKNAQNTLNQVNKLEAKLLTEKEGSYNRLSAQYSLNKIRLNQMSAEERAATEEGQKLEKETFDLYQEMKRLQEATGKHVLSVGDYTKATRDAGKEQRRLVGELNEVKQAFEEARQSGNLSAEVMNQYKAEIKDLTEQIDGLGSVTGKTAKDFEEGFIDRLAETDGVAGQAAAGVKGFGQSLKALLSNPVVLFIALIAGALVTLFQAFKRSEKGAELMAKATGLVQGILSELTGIATRVVDSLVKFANDPLEGIKNLGRAILENILNRIKAIPLIASAALDAFRALWERDTEALKQAGKDAVTAINQAVTGLDAESQKEFSEAIEESTNRIVKNTKAFIDLESAKRSVRKTNRDLQRSVEELTTAEEVNAAIFDDGTRSFEERRIAGEQARQALEKRSRLEVQIARNNLSLLNQEVALRQSNAEDVQDLLDQQLQAYQELKAAERGYTLAVQDNERTRRELKRDELERDLDILIDGFDNQKTINERIIKDQTIAFDQRANLLDQTRRLADDSFAKQIETIQQFTDIQVDANDLIAESDAVRLNEKIRALGTDEIIEGRILEIVRERRIALLDLSDAEKELNAERSKTLKAEAEAAKKLQKQRYDVELEAFDQLEAFEASKIDLIKMSEAERTKAQLQAQRDRLQKMLDLDEKYLGDLNAIQIATIENQITAIDKKIGKIDSGGINDIYDLFGFNLDDPQKQAIAESFNYAKQALDGYLEKRVEVADAAVAKSGEEVTAANERVNQEIAAGQLGYASRVDQARKELEDAKKNQAKAIAEQKKAQRAQQAIAAVEQATNMITASAKIWGTLGFPFAIPALAIMWGSFIAAQAKAFSVTRYREGGFEWLNYGGSHESGRDISLGMDSSGNLRKAERGEALAIFNRGKAMKYRSILPDIVESINRGTFDKLFVPVSQTVTGSGTTEINFDSGRMEDHLSAIRRRGDERIYTDNRGRLVHVRKNTKTTYVG